MSISSENPGIFPSSLTVQITEAERRLQNQRRSVRMRSAMLGRTLQQRMTDPVLLLWAGSLGFLAGEFTQCQMPKLPKLHDSPDAEHSFFETAFDLIKLVTSMRNLLTALPGSPFSASLANSVKIEEPSGKVGES